MNYIKWNISFEPHLATLPNQEVEKSGETKCLYWTRQWCSPQIWAAAGLPLFELMQQEVFSLTLWEHFLLHCKISGFAFVDNTDLCVLHPLNAAAAVAKQMQGTVSTWEGLLCVAGGALVPDKCFWHLIDFEDQNGKWMYKLLLWLPGTLFVHNDLGSGLLSQGSKFWKHSAC